MFFNLEKKNQNFINLQETNSILQKSELLSYLTVISNFYLPGKYLKFQRK